MSQRYLVAKFAPDMVRMETKNIGIILVADGHIGSRFLNSDEADFVDDKELYDRWMAFWNRIITERSISNGATIHADDPRFLDALKDTQKGNFFLFDGGRVIDKVSAHEINDATEFLFGEFVTIARNAATEDSPLSARLQAESERLFEVTGLKERPDWLGQRRITCSVKGVEQPFNFNYVLGESEEQPHAVFQRVPILRPQSINSSAFMLEWVGKNTIRRKAQRGAIIDSSDDSRSSNAAIDMLKKFATVIDINDERTAKRQLLKAAG